MFFSLNSWSDDILETPSIMDKLKTIDSITPSQWGVRSGCISVNKIRSISFLDDQLAIISLRGEKQLLLKLRTQCGGISKHGYSYRTRSGQLCPRFDRLTQVQSGIKCEIESIQPYIKLFED